MLGKSNKRCAAKKLAFRASIDATVAHLFSGPSRCSAAISASTCRRAHVGGRQVRVRGRPPAEYAAPRHMQARRHAKESACLKLLHDSKKQRRGRVKARRPGDEGIGAARRVRFFEGRARGGGARPRMAMRPRCSRLLLTAGHVVNVVVLSRYPAPLPRPSPASSRPRLRFMIHVIVRGGLGADVVVQDRHQAQRRRHRLCAQLRAGEAVRQQPRYALR